MTSSQESSDVYELVDNFLLTEVGKEYLSEMKNFRNEEVEDSNLRLSQTLSRFTQSMKQLPSLSISFPKFRVTPKYIHSPIRTHIDETRSSSIGLSVSIGSPTGPLSPKRDRDLGESIDDELLDEPHSLSSIYEGVNGSAAWTVVNGLSEPVVILSGQPPYFILKCSVDWHAVMGYSSEEVFGKCLEHFTPPDSLMSNPLLNQLHSTNLQQQQSRDSDLRNFNQGPLSEMTTYDALMLFYRQLQFQSLPHLHHHHLVLKLQTSDQRVIPFSIHALPLYKRQERRLAADSVSGISDHLKSFIDESYREGGDLPSPSKPVAFYAVYMNHLAYDRSHFAEQLQEKDDSERIQSFVDRVLSVASSTFSVRKSWMNVSGNGNGKNADASHYPSPPSVNPPDSEEEKWGGFLL